MTEVCIVAPGFVPSSLISLSFFAEILPWLLPIWAFVVMLAVWRWTNRDRGPVISSPTLYEAPGGLTPAEAATLIDKEVFSRNIAATMVDLAMRGYIRIAPRDRMLLGQNVRDYAFTLLKSRPTWDPALAGHELEVLDTLFPLDPMVDGVRNSETTLSFAAGQFLQAMPKICRESYRELGAKGLLHRGVEWRLETGAVCFALIFLPLGWVQWKGHYYSETDTGSIFLTSVVSISILLIFLARLCPMTVRGTRVRAACLSFRDFIERVDSDRLGRLPPERLEKLLPYAMAFGFEKLWTGAFHEFVTFSAAVELTVAGTEQGSSYASGGD